VFVLLYPVFKRHFGVFSRHDFTVKTVSVQAVGRVSSIISFVPFH
jgi:hypothetical protein